MKNKHSWRQGDPQSNLRGHPFMTSVKFSDFLTPPPCPRWATGLYYKIHATSLTVSAFPLPPPPLGADVINGWPPCQLLRLDFANRTVGFFVSSLLWLRESRVCPMARDFPHPRIICVLVLCWVDPKIYGILNGLGIVSESIIYLDNIAKEDENPTSLL